MKTLAIVMLAFSTLLTGCVVVPEDERSYNQPRYYDNQPRYDRDRDGVPNRQDRRPDDPRRY